MLYTQHIDTVVRANAYKLFGQQKDKYTNRYVASELVEEFISLYKACRFASTEAVFNKVYAAIDERAKCSKIDYNSDNDFTTTERATFVAAEIDAELEEELDIIIRPILRRNAKAATTIVKDIPVRQQKAQRYL